MSAQCSIWFIHAWSAILWIYESDQELWFLWNGLQYYCMVIYRQIEDISHCIVKKNFPLKHMHCTWLFNLHEDQLHVLYFEIKWRWSRDKCYMIRVYTCIYTCVQFNIKGLIDCLCSMWTSIESFVYVLSLTAKSVDIL